MPAGKKLTDEQQVAAYMEQLEHPLKQEIEEVRRLIVGADDRLRERIKWNAPSYCLNGDDRITFNLHGKGESFLLVFHCGAKSKNVPVHTPILEEDAGLLKWVTGNRATVAFSGNQDIEHKKDALKAVIVRWLEAAGTTG